MATTLVTGVGSPGVLRAPQPESERRGFQVKSAKPRAKSDGRVSALSEAVSRCARSTPIWGVGLSLLVLGWAASGCTASADLGAACTLVKKNPDGGTLAQPVLEIREANANVRTSATDTLTFTGYSDAACSTSVAGGVQVAGSAVAAVTGVATFPGMTALKTNGIRIRASNGTRTRRNRGVARGVMVAGSCSIQRNQGKVSSLLRGHA